MQFVVLTNETLKEELLSPGKSSELELVYIDAVEDFQKHSGADGFIDLLFEANGKRIDLLKDLSPAPVIVNSVTVTLEKINAPFIRINGWPGFLKRPMMEASINDKNLKPQIEKLFLLLNRKLVWVRDEPGFITARVIAMIINEAFLAQQENVSTKDEINTAMKLGTGYPYGPFEWCNMIGLKNIYTLLHELEETNSRYKPATLLQNETNI